MNDLKLGILLWNQATDWPSYLAAVEKIDELGYDHIWAWDHLYAIFGDPLQPIFEGWASLSAAAVAVKHLRLGLLVGANTFRNPGVVAKLATTLDHISGGRAILGLGGAWMRAGAHRVRHRLRLGLRAAARLARGVGRRPARDARWRGR